MGENSESTREFPKLFLRLALVSYILLGGGYLASKYLPSKSHDLVKWVEIPTALKKSRTLNKPILYLFTADWCPPCNMMKKEVFADSQFAGTVGHMFVPVKVVDRQKEQGSNPKEIEELQSKYDIEAFPTLIVASPTRAGTKRLEGYPGKVATRKFLTDSSVWAITSAMESPFKLDWRPLEALQKNGPSYKKPLLLFFLDESKTLNAFASFPTEELKKVLAEDFESYLISVDKSEKDKDKFWQFKQELIEEYRIDRFPTLVVDPAEKAIPHYLFNLSDPEDTLMFLENIADFTGVENQ